MRFTSLLFKIIFICISFSKVYSQTGYIDHFKNYTVEDGLPSNSVYSICEDNNGFIWIATADGLCRFDGYHFKIYKDLATDLTNNRKDFFRKIYKAHNGDLWIGMEYGLTHLSGHTGKFNNKFIINDDTRKNNFFQSTILPYGELKNGDILATHSTYGNIRIEPNTRVISYLFASTSPLNSAIVIASDKTRLAMIKNGDIFIYYYNENRYEHILHTNMMPVSSSEGGCLDGDFLYISQKNEVAKIDIQKKIVIKEINVGNDYATVNPVSLINITPNGNLVLATKGNGMYILDKDLNVITHYTNNLRTSLGLHSNIIETVYFDSEQHMWIGTDLGGLSGLPFNNRFGSSFYDLLRGKFISCFYRKDDLLFVGVYDEGLYKMDMVNKTTSIVQLHTNPKDIRSITELKGQLILGCEKGMVKYDPVTGIDQLMFQINPSDVNFRYLLKHNDSTAYSATYNRIYQIVLTKNNLMVEEILYGGNFTMISKGINNELIYCSKIRPNNNTAERISPFMIKLNGRFVLESCTRSILYNKELWVAETNGLLKLNNKYEPIDTFNAANSLLQTRIMSMELNKDDIWISCNNHLFQFNIPSSTFYAFDTFDGLTSIEFVSNSSYKDHEGFFYFGSIDGFIRFHPDSIRLKTKSKKPIITHIKIFNEEYIDTNKRFIDSLILSHQQNTVFVEFSSPEPLFQNRIEYAYQLGRTGQWVHIGNAHSFWLTDLPPGTYPLSIKTTNADGIWSEPYTLLYIYIRPPFWKTWWFISIGMVVVLVVLIITIYHLSTYNQRKKIAELKKQEAINTERMRISKDMHDEIGSGLSKIKILSDLLKDKNSIHIEDVSIMDSISETSGNMVNSMRELIWIINADDTSLEGLATRLREYTNDYLEDFSIETVIQFPEKFPDIKISREVYRNIFMIVKEALQNIVKHSHATVVKLEIQLQPEFSLTITDNGKGFNGSEKKGNGINNIKTRAALISGDINIQSTPGSTRIELKIPFNKLKSN